MPNPFLSVVIPAYNERERIGHTLESVYRYLRTQSYTYEIIVVDDGSKDGTPDFVKTFEASMPNLTLLVNEKNRGKGYSVKRGMLASTGEYRVFMDADNSVDISHLDSFLPAMQSGVDVAIGSIKVGRSEVHEHAGLHRRVLGSLANVLVQMLAVPGIHDTQRGFKVFSQKVADAIFPRQTIERFGFDIEVLVIARKYGFSIKELPVEWDNPAGSKVTAASYIQTLSELAKITRNRILRRYSKKLPLQKKNPTPKHLVPITSEDGRPKGFTYYGSEFVHHSALHSYETAFFNLIFRQKVFLTVLAGILALAFFINWHLTVVVLFASLTGLYFIDLVFNAFVIFQSYKTLPELSISEAAVANLRDEDCPTYTIFCPLYKEWQVVPQFVEAMQKLDYPHDKLQILFLLEENDQETIEKISQAELPKHFQIVVVPHSKPKTKPKAMNYGLKYATGEFIVIYDAEDVPEPDQLKKAVLAFNETDHNVACIQAKLNFYNPTQNILTRLFTAEYSLWFDLVLPGFQSIEAPIPLGGTSNHFRADILRHLDGWDAFNVTEDCDLGMRLAKLGFKTAIVDSTTYEEANSDTLNWYNQRSRWIKGYIQTYLVHTRNPQTYFTQGKGRDFFIFQLIVGGKILSLFINPLMWLTTILYFVLRARIGAYVDTFFPSPVLYLGVFSLVFGNFLYLYYYMVGCAKRGYDGLIKYIFLVPLYWLGMSVAAWKAMYEIIVKPHYWSKTVHGLHLTSGAPKLAVSKTAFNMQTVLDRQPPQISMAAFSAPLVLERPRIGTQAFAMREPSTPMFAPTPAPPEIRPIEIHIPVAMVSQEPMGVPIILESPKQDAPLAPLFPPTPFLAPRAFTTIETQPELIQILNDEGEYKKESLFAKAWGFSMSSAGLLVISMVLANFLNFAFNAYLGRVLDLDDFGVVTTLNTFIYLLNLFVGSLSTTVTHAVSYFEGTEVGRGTKFFNKTWMKIFIPSVFTSLLWILLVPFIGHFLHIDGFIIIASFAPTILFGTLSSYNVGYLQGIFSFRSLATISIVEATAKLFFAILIVKIGFVDFAVLSLPASILIAWISSAIALSSSNNTTKAKALNIKNTDPFPLDFYAASIMRGLSVAAFLSVDVILAKHYLSPRDAGLYSMLSLLGKMIFFFGTLLNVFVVAVVSRTLGEGKSTANEFAILFGATIALTIGAGVSLVGFGSILVPLLLGPQAVAILSFLAPYSISMMLFSLSTTIVLYRLSRKEYFFPAISLLISVLFVRGLISAHDSIESFVRVVTLVNVYYFMLIFFTHILFEELTYAYRNLRDLLSVFRPLPLAQMMQAGHKRVLIFNWRDSESSFAGGAETYIHNLAERWAHDGHSVTLFTSNDGKQSQNATIRGIRILRRGGFFAVYPLALVYYMCKLRGKFDVIIDCENGIPFFMPLVAKEPVFCLVHHIHQDVFRRSLPRPFAALAAFLEKGLMPLVYRQSTFVTVSESSKYDMEKLGMSSKPIEVIHPGVDLDFLSPGEKSPVPLVSYVGRLKDYKSVDVLINAFAQVREQLPSAKLIIAGDGDEANKLKHLVKELKLTRSVSFLGKVSEEKKREILRQSWVCVNPSLMEGWGITTIEANACGTTVIASDVSGLRDSVRHFETGLLVPYGQVEEFRRALIKVLTMNEVRHYMEVKSVEWASNFAWDTSSDHFISLITGIPARSKIFEALVKQVL